MTGALDLRVRRPRIDIDLSVLPTIRSLNHAIAKCAELVGSIDKTVAIDTGIDSPTWARIKQGEAGIKGEFLDVLMDACGNELPLLWLLHSRGYDPRSIHRYESDIERENRELKEQLQTEKLKNEHIAEFFAKARAA